MMLSWYEVALSVPRKDPSDHYTTGSSQPDLLDVTGENEPGQTSNIFTTFLLSNFGEPV